MARAFATLASFVMMLLLTSWWSPLDLSAQRGATGPVQITQQAEGVRFDWSLQSPDELESWPTFDFGGYELPGQLITLVVTQPGPVTVRIDQTEETAWLGELTPIPPERTPAQPLPPSAPTGPPTTAAFVLREGVAQETRLVVLAFSPIHGAPENMRLATTLSASVGGATLYDPTLPPASQQPTLPTAVVAQSPLRPDAPASPLAPIADAAITATASVDDAAQRQGALRVWLALGVMLLLLGLTGAIFIKPRR